VSRRETSADGDSKPVASSSSSSSSSSASSGAAGALSPGETSEERLLFDGALYLLTLLANVAESRPRHACALAEVDVAGALRRCGLDRFMGPSPAAVVAAAPEAPAGSSPWRALQAQAQSRYCFSPSLAHIRGAAAAVASMGSPGLAHSPAPASAALTLTQLAVSVLCRESAAFLPDLEAADRQLLARAQKAGPGAAAEEAAPPVEAAETTRDKDKLPVAELILSSHAALLLYTLCTGNGGGDDDGDDDDDGDADGAAIAARRAAVRACLPHASWWLPVRALKAFLVLQGQTGVMLVESVRPVVAAVTAMETHDGAPLSFPDAAAAAGRAAAAAASGRKRGPASSPAASRPSPPKKKASPSPARGPTASSSSSVSRALAVGVVRSSSSSWAAALGEEEEEEDDDDVDAFRFSTEADDEQSAAAAAAAAPRPRPRDAKPKMRAREARGGQDGDEEAVRPSPKGHSSAKGSPASSVVSRPASQSQPQSPSPARSSQASHGVAAQAAQAAQAVSSLPALGRSGGFHAKRKVVATAVATTATASAGAGGSGGGGGGGSQSSGGSGGGFHSKRKMVTTKSPPVTSSCSAFDLDF